MIYNGGTALRRFTTTAILTEKSLAMKYRFFFALLLAIITAAPCAADHTIGVLEEGPPADDLAAEIAKQLSETGYKVMRSEKSTLCHIWLAKAWKVPADFTATPEVLYPFQPGQLIGVVQYKRRGEDFREQDINSGVYTLRYAQQPVDGNHVGTSMTRDFLLVMKAEHDKSAEPLDPKKLFAASAVAAESSHPGLLAMQKVQGEAAIDKPTIRETDDEWQIIGIAGTAQSGDKTSPLRMELVIVGHADE